MMMMAGLTLFTDNEGEDEGHADAAFSRIDALVVVVSVVAGLPYVPPARR